MHKTFTVTLAIIALIGSNSNALADGSLPVVTHAASRPGEPPLVSLSPQHRGPLVARNDADDAGLVKIANTFTQYPNSPYYGWLGYSIFGPGPQAGIDLRLDRRALIHALLIGDLGRRKIDRKRVAVLDVA